MRTGHLKRILKIIVPSSLLMYFLLSSNLKIIYFYFKSFSIWIFITGSILTILSIYLNSIKWNLLLRNQSITSLFKLNLISQFYSLILTGQIAGEAVKTFILGKKNEDIEGIAVSVIVDKITGFLGLFIVILIGLFLTKTLYSSIILWSTLSAFVIGCFLLFCLQINFIYNIVSKFIEQIEQKFPKIKKVIQSLQKAFIAWHMYSKQVFTILLSIILGVFYQFMGVFVFFVFAKNLFIPIPIFDWFWIIGILSIALFIPITIGGIGVREGTLVGILGSLGILQEKALALSFLIFGMQIFISLIGGIIYWARPGQST